MLGKVGSPTTNVISLGDSNYIQKSIERNAPLSSRKRREDYGDGAAGTSGSSDDAFADAISMPEREDVSFHLHEIISIL